MIKRKETPDSGLGAVRGLYLVEQVSGKRSWCYRYRFAGRPTKFTLGPSPELNRKAARLLAMEAIVSKSHDVDPAAKRRELRAANRKPAPLDVDKIETVAAQFLKRHCANLKLSTQAEAARYMAKIMKAWPGRALPEITKPMIHALLDSIVDGGSPIAANRTLAWLSNLCSFAVQRDILAANPCTGIDKPAAETARARILTDDELTAVLKAADSLDKPYGDFVRMLALTGQRRNEVSDLVWDEIDFNAKVWVLPASRAKNKREHTIPLSDPVIAILKGLPHFAGCPFVFSQNGRTPIHAHDLVKKAIDKAMPDIQPWVLHDIRRTCASGMARLGTSLPTIEKILNHTSGSFSGIVGTYQRHSFADEKRAALETWARDIDNLMAGKTDGNVVQIRGHESIHRHDSPA